MRSEGRSRRDWYPLAGACLVAGAFFAARVWLKQYPSSPLVTAVGLPGPSANVGTQCGYVMRHLDAFRLPTRLAYCARRPGGAAQLRADEQWVSYDVLTRRVQMAYRRWSPPDSISWQRGLDSTRAAIRQRGGVPLHCARPEFPMDQVRSAEHWKLRDHTERLVGYRWDESNSLNQEWRWQPWLLELDAYACEAPDCGTDRAGPR